MHRLTRVIIGLLGFLGFAAAGALDFNPTLAQLNHRAFTRLEGAPATIYALAQTTDGTLWLGSDTGLTRFDGTKFINYPEKSDDPLPSSIVSALLSSPDGGLWIGFRLGGICFLHKGRLTRHRALDRLSLGTVYRLAYDRDGSLLVATSGGLVQLRGESLQRIAPDVIHGAVDVLVDRAGTWWVATHENVVARSRSDSQFHEVAKTERATEGLTQVFAEAPDGRIWASTPGLLTSRNPLAPGSGDIAMHVAGGRSGRLLIDSSGNYWFGSPGSISRSPASRMIADMRSSEHTVRAEVFSKTDGLTDEVTSMLEDREHNVWIGTLSGLDRFSPTRVVRALPRCAGVGYALAAGRAGELWAACGAPSEIGRSSILQFQDGKVIAEHAADNFTAAYRENESTLWFGGPGQIASFDGQTLAATPLPAELRDGRDVQALAKDASGALWVSVVRHGVYRLMSGRWAPAESVGLPREPAIVETSDDDGSVWFGYPADRITRLQGGAIQQFSAAEGLEVGNVTAIQRADGQLWVGGEIGFCYLNGGRFSTVRTASGTPIKEVSGIAGAENGDLWLNASGGIVRIGAEEVRSLVRDPNYPIQAETLDVLDGVPGDPIPLRPTPSAVATTDGRVWFGMTGGVAWIDASGSSKNKVAPPVTLWALESGGERYSNGDQALHLPALPGRLQLEYSAGSLMVPEHVRFRYKLTGFDRDWQDAGGRREAYYTNLGPGSYTFRVIGSNNDGVWNETGASMVFTIAPAFYQTLWFRTLCAAAIAAAIWVVFRLRLQQLHKRHEAMNQARLEMTHVARLATLSAMTASITHEVSQPISGILTNSNTCARMLAADPPNVAGAAETLRRTIRDANRASEVIARLRAMFAKKAPVLERVDLNEAVREVIALSAAELQRAGAVLETEFAEPLAAVNGDRVQLQQVILNLLLNAADAMTRIEERPRILRVQTRMTGDESAEVLVRDSGVGIDPNTVDKLFVAFHTTKAHGLGIGLSISRSIIESHKGKLWARANDGHGATFGFSIPRAPDTVS
jgi:signal transduction histidine kinase/ligand-binding sensor domain-containing protein